MEHFLQFPSSQSKTSQNYFFESFVCCFLRILSIFGVIHSLQRAFTRQNVKTCEMFSSQRRLVSANWTSSNGICYSKRNMVGFGCITGHASTRFCWSIVKPYPQFHLCFPFQHPSNSWPNQYIPVSNFWVDSKRESRKFSSVWKYCVYLWLHVSIDDRVRVERHSEKCAASMKSKTVLKCA